MIYVNKVGVLLAKSGAEFENEGVLNPACIRVNDSVHMYYRAVQKGNHSTIGYCRFDGPLTLVERWDKPLLVPEHDYESHGVEDARITKIEDTYYLSYTGYDGINARACYATSTDLINFTKKGVIAPPITYARFVSLAEQAAKVNENYYRNHNFYYHEADPEMKVLLWDKNVVFFPRKIDNKIAFLHRIRPGIQLVMVDDMEQLDHEYWKEYFHNFHEHIVMDPIHKHESSYIGSGCTPIETEHGWLLIYHGVETTKKGLVYSACAALLDLHNPFIEIARLPYALFSPQFDYEFTGVVNNVVFPTGSATFGDTLFIYYGAADDTIGCATVNLKALVAELLTHTTKHEE